MFDLDQLVADYIELHGGWPTIERSPGRDSDWGGETLHATDLSRCPRQVGMRLRGDTPEPFPPQKIRQFWAANQQHELIYLALQEAGKLVDCEVYVPMPDGWSGTADMILREYHDSPEGEPHFHVADSKNPHPNMVAYYKEYPKYEDILQVSTYSYWLNKEGGIMWGDALEGEGEVFYMPLGGAGKYLPTRFPLLDAEEHILPKMRTMEAARDQLPTLFDPLPLEVRWARKGEGSSRRLNRNIAGGDIVLGTNWQCGYCRFDCEMRHTKAILLAKISTAGGRQSIDLTSKGRKYEDAITDLLIADASARR